MKYRPDDEVELVGNYTFGGQEYLIHSEKIHNGINHGIVHSNDGFIRVLWDEYTSAGPIGVDPSCIRPFRGEPITEDEEREILESLSHSGSGLNSARAQLRAQMKVLQRLDPDLFQEVAES